MNQWNFLFHSRLSTKTGVCEMIGSMNNSMTVSNANAGQASAGRMQAMKGIFANTVKSIARALMIPQIMRHAREANVPKFAAIASVAVLGPGTTDLLMLGIKKTQNFFASRMSAGEKQPLLPGKQNLLL